MREIVCSMVYILPAIVCMCLSLNDIFFIQMYNNKNIMLFITLSNKKEICEKYTCIAHTVATMLKTSHLVVYYAVAVSSDKLNSSFLLL